MVGSLAPDSNSTGTMAVAAVPTKAEAAGLELEPWPLRKSSGRCRFVLQQCSRTDIPSVSIVIGDAGGGMKVCWLRVLKEPLSLEAHTEYILQLNLLINL